DLAACGFESDALVRRVTFNRELATNMHGDDPDLDWPAAALSHPPADSFPSAKAGCRRSRAVQSARCGGREQRLAQSMDAGAGPVQGDSGYRTVNPPHLVAWNPPKSRES